MKQIETVDFTAGKAHNIDCADRHPPSWNPQPLATPCRVFAGCYPKIPFFCRAMNIGRVSFRRRAAA